ncbi:hypothetical protein ONS95_005137 [Cadophora gregata]|uniref:uncharacterized protein n=1 Tax=Cadophora gregata TaxID=51156 RepID=UPI0026DB080A|nr:uncharacterized protein ONS95_005137 [Cadophora gregata]KAK0104871.1 hypothetical protein ONS95_005137 [Cadophora gregata]KAK0115050.1 hypothetical protein ONS96_013520 [Cadophora gregata f. sp. sojae]
MDDPNYWEQPAAEWLDFFGDLNFDMDFSAGPFLGLDCSSPIQSNASAHYNVEDSLNTLSGTASPKSSLEKMQLPPTLTCEDATAIKASRPTSHSTPRDIGTRISRQSPEAPDSDKRSSSAGLKRKIDQSVTVFSSTSSKEVTPRKRKTFSASRKKEVALNRKVGVCIQCKIRKNRCTFGLPCEPCITRAGGAALGHQLCMRQSLLSIRFDNVDLVNQTRIESDTREIRALHDIPSSKPAYLWFPGSPLVPEAFLKIHVIEFQSSGYQPTRDVIFHDYFHSSASCVPNSHLALDPRRLPSIEEILKIFTLCWDGVRLAPGPFSGLHKAVEKFVESYCNRRSDMPMKDLLAKITRLYRLFGLYRIIPYTWSTPDCVEGELASPVILAQLRLLVCGELKSVEIQVFSALYRLIYDQGNIGRQNSLAVWACLWALLFTYKHHMVFTRSTLPEYDISPMIHAARFQLNQHLYNTLTSTYAALYNSTSPLTLDWRTEEIASLLDRDPELIKLFCNIKTEMFWFYAIKDSLLEEDTLFKSLIIENESKLLRAHIKAAKKKGIL